jgi:cytoskeletal protein CcmA (bactofilin family)
MFDKKFKIDTDLQKKTNRIVEGTQITGNIESATDFRIDGVLIGNYYSKAKLVIGNEGKVKGDIVCQNLDIEGKFEGKIQVVETLNLKAKAIVKGEVICGKLAVEPGAEFTGSCTMKTDVKNLLPNAKTTEKTA